MAELKMPELNNVIVAGNLTKDPVFRQTSNNTPVVNFHVAANRRYKDSNNQWQEDVCYVGIVAWNKLADSCKERLKKGSAVLIDGELQSRTFKTEDNKNRTIVEIKAKRIQFLNKHNRLQDLDSISDDSNTEDPSVLKELNDDGASFDKFLTNEESDLLNNK
ncbi:MAG: single-stranded DNA-binding protein [Ignavibacteriales bacterium]|nr:single-stranded DNA-binding protein [Ignavibacteriales bacterium]